MRLVRLWFTDVLGNLKSFAISPAELENALEDGMTFDGSSIDGFSRVQESRRPRRADAEHLRAAAVGRPQDARGADLLRHPQPRRHAVRGRPPQVLRRHLDRRTSSGFTFYVAPDIEFFYFAPPGDRAADAARHGSFFDLTTTDVAGSLRKQTIRTLEAMGIPVEYSFHEDAPSQQEIDLRHTDALTMADSVMTFRLVVREVAAAEGCYATFMPKPLEGVQGSGMHTHSRCSGATRTRSTTPTTPTTCQGRQVVHGRPAAPRRRDHRDHEPDGQHLQAAGARLRGADPRELGPQQPQSG